MHKVILDTDIGTDVDDLLTLAFLLGSPDVDLLGVTAAYGDTQLRGKLARHALSLAGRSDVPVAVGELPTLRGQRKVYWAGHEGKNAYVETLPVLEAQDAADFILQTLRRYPGEVTLLAVAPLTNVAQALERDPETMGEVGHIVMMGGVFGLGGAPGLPAAEHNFRCDPEAAHIVFGSSLPITLFPLDMTVQTPFTREQLGRLRGCDTPLFSLIVREVETFLAFVGRDHCHLHDPLTAASIVDPEIITGSLTTGLEIGCGDGATDGSSTPNSSNLDSGKGANVRVVTAFDAPHFYELFFKRMLGSGEAAG